MKCCAKGTFECDVKVNDFYVDKCIADIVQALNDGGLSTIASCCGHKKQDGIISLRDGRELIIRNDKKCK